MSCKFTFIWIIYNNNTQKDYQTEKPGKTRPGQGIIIAYGRQRQPESMNERIIGPVGGHAKGQITTPEIKQEQERTQHRPFQKKTRRVGPVAQREQYGTNQYHDSRVHAGRLHFLCQVFPENQLFHESYPEEVPENGKTQGSRVQPLQSPARK